MRKINGELYTRQRTLLHVFSSILETSNADKHRGRGMVEDPLVG